MSEEQNTTVQEKEITMVEEQPAETDAPFNVVTFGELLMRLSPCGQDSISQADGFDIAFTGAEASVAVNLTHHGLDAAFITKLPDNELGQRALNELQKYGVNTDSVIRGGERIGIRFEENGVGEDMPAVIDDTRGTAFSDATEDEFDWDVLLKDATWLHFTGLTPALGGFAQDICLEALFAAKRLGVTMSCDLCYCEGLWDEAGAERVMSRMMEYVDVCIITEEDAAALFKIRAVAADLADGAPENEAMRDVAEDLMDRFEFGSVALTKRDAGMWSALLFDGRDYCASKQYSMEESGGQGVADAFAAGLIYACLEQLDQQQTIEFAAAAGSLKHKSEGPYNLASVEEIKALAEGTA